MQLLEVIDGTGMRGVIGSIACVIFLAIAFVVWLASGRSWLVWLMLLVPSYGCGEYLSSKLFSEQRGLSIAESGNLRGCCCRFVAGRNLRTRLGYFSLGVVDDRRSAAPVGALITSDNTQLKNGSASDRFQL